MLRLNGSLKCLWLLVGIIIIGGIYLLSYNNVDQVAVKETSIIIEFLRTTLTK